MNLNYLNLRLATRFVGLGVREILLTLLVMLGTATACSFFCLTVFFACVCVREREFACLFSCKMKIIVGVVVSSSASSDIIVYNCLLFLIGTSERCPTVGIVETVPAGNRSTA